jgi:hypothetical protein
MKFLSCGIQVLSNPRSSDWLPLRQRPLSLGVFKRQKGPHGQPSGVRIVFRNLSKRIGVVTPILAAGPKQRLWEILDICLRDQRESWVLDPDGKYEQLRPESGSIGPEANGTHQTLMNLALARAKV